jgi:hypothetical protein
MSKESKETWGVITIFTICSALLIVILKLIGAL